MTTFRFWSELSLDQQESLENSELRIGGWREMILRVFVKRQHGKGVIIGRKSKGRSKGR